MCRHNSSLAIIPRLGRFTEHQYDMLVAYRGLCSTLSARPTVLVSMFLKWMNEDDKSNTDRDVEERDLEIL